MLDTRKWKIDFAYDSHDDALIASFYNKEGDEHPGHAKLDYPTQEVIYSDFDHKTTNYIVLQARDLYNSGVVEDSLNNYPEEEY